MVSPSGNLLVAFVGEFCFGVYLFFFHFFFGTSPFFKGFEMTSFFQACFVKWYLCKFPGSSVVFKVFFATWNHPVGSHHQKSVGRRFFFHIPKTRVLRQVFSSGAIEQSYFRHIMQGQTWIHGNVRGPPQCHYLTLLIPSVKRRRTFRLILQDRSDTRMGVLWKVVLAAKKGVSSPPICAGSESIDSYCSPMASLEGRIYDTCKQPSFMELGWWHVKTHAIKKRAAISLGAKE